MNFFNMESDAARAREAERDSVSPGPSIAFLLAHGIANEVLRRATIDARRDGVDAARALIAYGGVSESLFYRRLADHLGVPFIAGWPQFASPYDAFRARRRGVVRLGDKRWMLAPTDDLLRRLAASGRIDDPHNRLCLTTPSHFAALARLRGGDEIVKAASHDLADRRPDLSARGLDNRTVIAVFGGVALVGAIICAGRAAATDAVGLLFLAGMTFRMIVCAAALDIQLRPIPFLAAREAPIYTVLVPLLREAHMIPRLVEALARLDYPRAKIEVLFLIEAGDGETRDALHRIVKPPWFQVVLVPGGSPRTKPRALNAGLAVARGDLLTVYDAEDRPDADQLKRAAATFAQAPDSLACLQARLRIGNGAKALLAGIFAIEYAILFELVNVGIARLGFPMALGGTSNHFRTAALRAVGGWDAWNVTEDADLGFRLARFGYGVDSLDSVTCEEAPISLPSWFRQRRRWAKGWLQTSLVLARGGRATLREFGAKGTIVVGLMLVGLVLGPLASPVFIGVVMIHLYRDGWPTPHGFGALGEATVAYSVIALGIISTLWSGFIGLRRVEGSGWSMRLPWLLPYQLLISLAAWGGLYDLIRDPYHWHKTDHIGD